MNAIIASLGFSTALWIFSKAVLNIVKASNLWANLSTKSREVQEAGLDEGFKNRMFYVKE